MRLITIAQTVIFLFMLSSFSNSQQAQSILDKEYNLAGERTKEEQYFIMETAVTNYSLDGKITGRDFFNLYLMCSPLKESSASAYKYTCEKFTVKKGDSQEVRIPGLNNWPYIFDKSTAGIDDKGQVFGIDHSKFDNLKDNFDQPIPPSETYLIYNAFIDFHAFCNVFAEPTTIDGTGIQNLSKINDSIVHAAAFTKAPVNLGKNVKKGSYYENGEVTLAFIGLGKVNDNECALIQFDSGEGSFKMRMTPMPNMDISTTGASHYKGNIYINMKSFWVEKVVMDEFVLSETTLPVPPNKINIVTERKVVISNVSKEHFINSL